jgi:hypothetical protein
MGRPELWLFSQGEDEKRRRGYTGWSDRLLTVTCQLGPARKVASSAGGDGLVAPILDISNPHILTSDDLFPVTVQLVYDPIDQAWKPARRSRLRRLPHPPTSRCTPRCRRTTVLGAFGRYRPARRYKCNSRVSFCLKGGPTICSNPPSGMTIYKTPDNGNRDRLETDAPRCCPTTSVTRPSP